MDPNLNQNQPIPVEPPTSPKPNPASNTLIVLLVALSFILFASTGFLAYQSYQLKMQAKNSIGYGIYTPSPYPIVTSTPDPTVNWKTYTNPSWKISFMYPTTWNDIAQAGESFISTDASTKVNLKIDKGTYNANLPLNLYSAAFSTKVGEIIIDNENTKISDVMIDGHATAVFTMDGLNDTQQPPSYSYVYVIKDGDSLFIFNFWSQDSVQSKANVINQKTTFDQIVSTFKFTN